MKLIFTKRFECNIRNSFIEDFLRFHIKRKFIEDATMKASEFSTASFAYSIELDYAENLFTGSRQYLPDSKIITFSKILIEGKLSFILY